MIKLGTNRIGKVYLGSNSIGKAYLGSNLVFQKGGGIQPVMIPYIRGGADGSYIDTGITPNSTTRVIVWARNFNPYGGIIFGSRVAYQNQAFALSANGYSQSGLITIQYGNVAIDAPSGDHFQYLSGYHKYEMQPISVSVDDAQLFTGSGSFSGNSLNLHLFGVNNEGAHTSTFLPMDICACQIYKDGILVRDFTAVNTPSVGFYDAVSQTLFTNAGSGSFIYGEFDKNAYTPLEYIECDGNQYFDSGAYGTYSGGIVVKFMPKNTTPTFHTLLGYRTTTNSCDISIGTDTSANIRIYWRFGANDTSAHAYNSSSLTNNAVVAVKSNATLTIYKNNTQIGTNTKSGVSTTFKTDYSLSVGTLRKSETVFNEGFIGNLYYAGFASDRSFVPAKKGSKVGMYDTYNDVFYTSATDTPFIAGPTI